MTVSDVNDIPLDRAYQTFLARYPEYGNTAALDALRAKEFARLDTGGHVYADYTGGGLYGASQVQAHMAFLLTHVLGNPHSSNPASREITERVLHCRTRILEYFNASPDEYVVVFTANASHALKLVGEAYPFEQGSAFLLTFDNHNSVNGIREFARMRSATTRYVPAMPPDLRTSDEALDRFLEEGRDAPSKLFAFPPQSNFSGVQHPLEWIARAQARGWDVLLDAAAFVPTNRLDLGRWHPDYVALSFYKMFGYPTGVGALLARRAALGKLHRPSFAGGTVELASVQADRYVLVPGSEAFEDGTLNYAALPAVDLGLDFLDAVGVETIHTRVRCLTGWLIERLLALHHRNGQPVVRLFGPPETRGRGGTISINLYGPEGTAVDHDTVIRRANSRNISLRTGCVCNPGAGEVAMGLSRDVLRECLQGPDARMTLDEFEHCIGTTSVGAVRLSLGMVSNFADVEALVRLADSFRA